MLLEQNDEWQLQHRYLQVEAMAELIHAQPSQPQAIHCAIERHECQTLGRSDAVKPRSRAAVRQRRKA
jgi:hypothetical protein